MKLMTFDVDNAGKLKYLPFNRNATVRTDLMEKMHQYGFTVPINIIKTDIITGKSSLWIADGQHRAMTALHIGIPFTGIVNDHLIFKSKADIVKYVSSLNSASKPWTLLNYVEAYNFLNYEDYARLLKVTNNSPYSVNVISSIMVGVRGKGRTGSAIKNGTYKITLYNEAITALKFAARLGKYERVTARMMLALGNVMLHPRFDAALFEEKYMNNAKQVKELNLDDYTDMFQSWLD